MKNFNQFLFEEIISDPKSLLDSINAKKVSTNIFNININDFKDIEDLFEDEKFNKELINGEFKKDNLESTKEYETFLKNTLNVKYFLIFKDNQNELEKPKYIFIQIKKDQKWGTIQFYKVNSNMKNFYDLLTNKKIEIKSNGKSYIYVTTNGGFDWTLQNLQNQDSSFKNIMRNEDINKILQNSIVQEID